MKEGTTMEELTIREGTCEDFWRQMYEEASDRRKHAAKAANAYKARALAAEKSLARLKKGLLMVGVFIGAAANGVYWVMVLTGR